MSIPQDYTALAAKWPSITGVGLTEQLAALNSTIASTATDPVTQIVTNIYWPEANGWQGGVNQNDLVVAGIITDDQRKAYEGTFQ